MLKIISEYDAKENLAKAETAYAQGKRKNLSEGQLKDLEKEVRNAKAVLKNVRAVLKASKK